jgi:tol-pal system protein YbgF
MNHAKKHSQKAWIILGLLAFGAFATPIAARAQDTNSRLNRLENELETLNRAVYRGENPPPGSFSAGASSDAGTEVRIQQLETQLRELQGRIEEQSHSIEEMRQQLERSLSDFEMRLGDASAGTGGGTTGNPGYASPSSSVPYSQDFEQEASGQQPPQPAPQDNGYSDSGSGYSWNSNNTSGNAGGNVASGQLGTLSESGAGGATDNAAVAYEHAFSLLKGSNYTEASREFEAFIAQNPQHALVPNAKYWLGESYYVRGEYETSARIFAEGYQQYPKGAKAADNLLKLGMSLSGLGKNEDACIAYGQLEKDFSGTAAPVMRRAQQEMTRLNCA